MKRTAIAALIVVELCTGSTSGQSARQVLDTSAAALGAASLRSIQYSGRGSDFIFGQAYDGRSPWPRFSLPAITVSIDYTTPALLDDRRRAQAENPPLGGGFQPLLGEQRQIWALSGSYAWDITGQTVAPAAVERDYRSAVAGRTAQIWLTPHGFVKAALASSNAAVTTHTIRGIKKTVVTFTTPTGVKLEGTLDEQHLVERIATWLDNPVLGDVVFEAVLSGYRDFGGVKFPTRIVQRSAGYPVLDVTVTDVKPNAPLALEVPAAIRQPAAAAGPLVPEPIGDGLWIVPGNAKSIVVEFRDHLVVVDAPENEARSVAVMDAIAKLLPGKPVRYVINTHSHFDHAGGLRTYAAAGVTIVTERDNIPYYQQVWGYPRTINPDRLAKSGRTPVFDGVIGSRTFTDGARTMTVYHYAGNMHNPGMLMVHLPKERILIEADSYTPPANAADPPGGMANLVQFAEALDRLRLDVEQIVPIHGRLVTPADIQKAVETFGSTSLWRR
jgi:glyoxylase-like metal-dependent hydrolase (beta-lactamase superfamily II)